MLRSVARAGWRHCVPERIRAPINKARQALVPTARTFVHPTYADDGLISQHVCDFLKDRKFMAAYDETRAGVPWAHPGEIHYRAYIACWAAERGLSLGGDLVECGVGHGILSGTICRYLDLARTNRAFYLCDTFAGIPIDTDLTPAEMAAAERFNRTHYAGDMYGQAKAKFASFPSVRLVRGVVPQSLDQVTTERISYLSLDMNNATAEIGAIVALWDRLVSGATVLLDDYAYGEEFRDQKNAWDAFAKSKGFAILSLPTGQGLIIKA